MFEASKITDDRVKLQGILFYRSGILATTISNLRVLTKDQVPLGLKRTIIPSVEAVLSSHSYTSFVANPARFGLALIAIQRADTALPSEQYAVLQINRQSEPEFSTDRLLGLLARTMGNLTQAMSHFEEGLAFCRKAGFRPELAWTCCDYADMVLERKAEGDRSQAASLLDEAMTISGELGIRPLMERVLSRREILKA